MFKNNYLLLALVILFFSFCMSCSMEVTAPINLTTDDNTAKEEPVEEEEVIEPEVPLTCEQMTTFFNEYMTAPVDCESAGSYLDEMIEGDCMAGDFMSTIEKVTRFIDAGGCISNCIERQARADAYLDTGNTMSAIADINWIALSGLCVDICKEVTAHYNSHGGGFPLEPCE